MQIVIDTLSQANRENAPSFTDELRRLLIKLSPLKEADKLLKMKISLPQEEEGDSGIVLPDSNEFSVRSASGWKQAFNKMRGITGTRDETRFDNGPANIMEGCAEDMIGTRSPCCSSHLLGPLKQITRQHFGRIRRLNNSSSSVDYVSKSHQDSS